MKSYIKISISPTDGQLETHINEKHPRSRFWHGKESTGLSSNESHHSNKSALQVRSNFAFPIAD